MFDAYLTIALEGKRTTQQEYKLNNLSSFVRIKQPVVPLLHRHTYPFFQAGNYQMGDARPHAYLLQ